jgi:hypothetical protein
MARPVVPLLNLVRERRFDAKNKRHRAKLLTDDSLLEFVAWNEVASVRLRVAAKAQERYRQSHASGGVEMWPAGMVEACARRLDDDGEPLDRPLVML